MSKWVYQGSVWSFWRNSRKYIWKCTVCGRMAWSRKGLRPAECPCEVDDGAA